MTFCFCYLVKHSSHWYSNTTALTFVSFVQFLFMLVTSTGSVSKNEKKKLKSKNHDLNQMVRQCNPLEMFIPAILACFLFVFTFSDGVLYLTPRFFNYYSSVCLTRYTRVEKQILGWDCFCLSHSCGLLSCKAFHNDMLLHFHVQNSCISLK